MPAPYKGIGGSVKAGANTLGNIGNWSTSEKANTTDTTPMSSTGSTRNTPTTLGWTASFDGWCDPLDAGHIAFLNAGIGATYAFEFAIGSSGHKKTGSGILTGLDIKSTSANVITIACTVVNESGVLAFT